MELFVGALALLVIGYFVFFRKKDESKVEAVPYKVEAPIPAGTEASVAASPAPAATTLDPVAVALDLEPLQISQPAKAPRKPRAPKEAVKKAAPKKAAAIKAKPKAAPKAKSKKV